MKVRFGVHFEYTAIILHKIDRQRMSFKLEEGWDQKNGGAYSIVLKAIHNHPTIILEAIVLKV